MSRHRFWRVAGLGDFRTLGHSTEDIGADAPPVSTWRVAGLGDFRTLGLTFAE